MSSAVGDLNLFSEKRTEGQIKKLSTVFSDCICKMSMTSVAESEMEQLSLMDGVLDPNYISDTFDSGGYDLPEKLRLKEEQSPQVIDSSLDCQPYTITEENLTDEDAKTKALNKRDAKLLLYTKNWYISSTESKMFKALKPKLAVGERITVSILHIDEKGYFYVLMDDEESRVIYFLDFIYYLKNV